jgi:hypothetical protein
MGFEEPFRRDVKSVQFKLPQRAHTAFSQLIIPTTLMQTSFKFVDTI